MADNYPVHHMRGFSDLASLFNCGTIILTLGSYGLLLPASVFWLCWTILVINANILYTIRPFRTWIDTSDSAHGRAGVVFLKVCLNIALIVILFHYHDFAQRQNKILLFAALSITLYEGFLYIAVAREKLKTSVSNSYGKGNKMMWGITEGYNWNAVKLLIPSAINVMMCVTGAIVLGGKLGSILSDNLYWIVLSLLVVDLMAEGIHRFDCGNRSAMDPVSEPLPTRRYVANVLRVVVEGLLCYCMMREIPENHYYRFDLDGKACGSECEERSRSLLMAMAALSGIQATVAFAVPLCSFVLCGLVKDKCLSVDELSLIPCRTGCPPPIIEAAI